MVVRLFCLIIIIILVTVRKIIIMTIAFLDSIPVMIKIISSSSKAL